jgi:hypothetical protein
VHTLGGDWERALDALAAVEEEPDAPLASLVAPRGPVGTVLELVVVTPRPEAGETALAARASLGRPSAVVALDTPTYAGRPASSGSATLLRLASAGVAVAVLRHGEPVGEALGRLRMRDVG